MACNGKQILSHILNYESRISLLCIYYRACWFCVLWLLSFLRLMRDVCPNRKPFACIGMSSSSRCCARCTVPRLLFLLCKCAKRVPNTLFGSEFKICMFVVCKLALETAKHIHLNKKKYASKKRWAMWVLLLFILHEWIFSAHLLVIVQIIKR